MRYWKFVCKRDTEAECFQRMLFGDTMDLWKEVKNVRRGDILFLYNLETDILYGPFVAKSDGGLNIEPDAWSGKFPAQVRVKLPGAIAKITGALAIFPFLKERRCELTKEEGRDVLGYLLMHR